MTVVAPFFKSGPKSGSGASPAGSKESAKGQPDRRSGAGQKFAPAPSQPAMDPDDVLDLAADPRASAPASRGPIARRAEERSRVVASPRQAAPVTPAPPARVVTQSPPVVRVQPAPTVRVVTQSPPIVHEPPRQRSREGTVFGSAESLSGTILSDTHTKVSEPLLPRLLDGVTEKLKELGSAASKVFPKSSQVRLGIVGVAILLVGVTLKIAFSHPVMTLRVNANHPFRAAQIIVWVDQEQVLNDVMTGGSGLRKRVYPYQFFLGSYTRSMTVPAGPHLIQVRVAATDEGFDLSRTLNTKLKKDSTLVLQVSCGPRSMAISTVDLKAAGKFRKAAQQVEASVWFDRYASPVFFSLGGSAMSAAVAFFIQEILKRARTKAS